jgi:hypothetical protein
MNTIRGSPHSKLYAGLLPVEPSDEFVRPTTPENDQLPNRRPSLRKRALPALAGFLLTFCIGVAATLASQSYGDAARQMIANSHSELRWLAPGHALNAQKAPDTIALAASAASYPGQQQLDAMSRDLHAMRQGIERIAARQEQITRSIDQIAAIVAAGQELTRDTDQTATGIAQAASAKASDITVESRADGAPLQPTVRLNMESTETRPPQTWSDRGKQLSAVSGHDISCFPSASAVLQDHRGGWPSWTLKAPGHEGTMCWYASTRPRARDHRSEMVQRKEMVGTTENEISARSVPYTRAPE